MITKNYVPAKYITAKKQTPQLDEYTEKIQRSHNDPGTLEKQIHPLKMKNHHIIARLEKKFIQKNYYGYVA